jgi:hypothetical protein
MSLEDYVSFKERAKSDPYIIVKKTLEVALEDQMTFIPSSQKWQIDGCARFVTKEDKELWGGGAIFASKNEHGEWIILNELIQIFIVDGKHVPRSCDKNLKLPINIKVSELK